MRPQTPDPLGAGQADPQLARLTRLLRAAPTEGELAGQDDAVKAFRAARCTPPRARRGRSRALFPSLVGAKFGATIAGVAVGLTGIATAAVLPTTTSAGPAERASTVSAPALPAVAAVPTPTTTAAPPSAARIGPVASGPAVKGLCTAWRTHAAKTGEDHGRWQATLPFTNLVAAAGRPADVESYCAKVLAPTPRSPSSGRASQPSGNPTARPVVTPPAIRRGPPTAVPVGPPPGPPPSSRRPTGIPAPPVTRPTLPNGMTPPTRRTPPARPAPPDLTTPPSRP
jgi:hypothetical protein